MKWIPAALMFGLFAIRVPVAFAIAIAALSFFLLTPGTQTQAFIQRLVSITYEFPLLAIPFFIFTGVMINYGGMGRRIINLAESLVGHMVGGLAQSTVLIATLMAGMSGSSTAEAAMLTKVLVPEMERKGYDKGFATALTACSALIGTLIPPSIGLILFGVLANVSIGRLFMGGVVPGLLMCIALMVVVKVIATRRGYVPSRTTRATAGERLTFLGEAVWALVIPFGIIGGIRFGAFTPTEAGAVAAIYTAAVSAFIYRELTWEKLIQGIVETVLLTSIVMMIISAANSLGFYLAWEQIPAHAAEAVLTLSRDPYLFLLAFNIFVLILGMFMDGAMMLVLLTPLLIPIIDAYGIDPVHFGVVFMLNLEIGAITPPVGIVMYTATSIAGISIERFTREGLPMLAALVIVLLLITYIPELVLWLPNLLFD